MEWNILAFAPLLGELSINTRYTCLYIDPSVATYAIQVVAGVIVAVGAVVGVRWKKAKKKIQDKLGIDENRGKEVEEDVVSYEDSDDTKADNTARD